MAYWRSLSTRAANTARRHHHHHHHPSIAHILHDDDDRRSHDAVSDHATSPPILNHFLAQKRFFGNNTGRVSGLGGFSNATLSNGCRFLGSRYMSTAIGGGSDKAELLSDVSGVLSDASIEAVVSNVPAMSEVAIAAADSYLPVKALQYAIDYVHISTGLNWWAAIAITTLLIRSATIPFLINQVKVTSKMSLIKPQLDDIKQEMQDAGMSPVAVAEGNRKTQKLFKEYGLHPLSPLKGLFISAPVFISFFLAISNMAEKVPSFKTGGAYWFTDLSTPDSMYIFPSLAALTFLITVECNMLEGVDANSAGKTMKNISRGFAVLTIPFTMSFPKALFCYWITSNLFSLGYGLVLKSPKVRSSLGIPQLPPPSTAPSQRPPQPAFSMFSALKQVATAAKAEHSSHAEPPKVSDGRMSSSSVLSQRIKSLEKQVKGRKRNKKR